MGKIGDDANLFDFDSNNGLLKFKENPDYKNPKSKFLSNEYFLTLKATDRGITDKKHVFINVLPQEHSPSIDSDILSIDVEENTSLVKTFTASDNDYQDSITWSINGVDVFFQD